MNTLIDKTLGKHQILERLVMKENEEETGMIWRTLSALGLSVAGAILMLTLALLLLTLVPNDSALAATQDLPIPQNKPHLLSTDDNNSHTEQLKDNNALSLTTATEWDDADSHKWIGEAWGGDAPSSLTWGDFHSRNCLEIRWDYPAWLGYIRTDTFPDENWEAPVTGLRADVYVESTQSWTDIGVEPRNHNSDTIELLGGNATNLTPGQWHTVSWTFTEASDYQAVAGLVFKLDQLGNYSAAVYLDNIRLLTATNETEWDDMDDGSRQWFYFGNWYKWFSGPGPEPISHNGGNQTTPAGSVYLQWDYENSIYTGTTAEVGTGKLDDVPDWGRYNRISADVKVSDPDVPLSVFFLDADAITSPTDYRGLGVPTRKVGVSDTWRTVTWDIPWAPWFNNTGVDELKFIVNNIDEHPTGTLYLDNIYLISDALPSPVTGLNYIFEDFNDKNESFTDFSSNWGPLVGDNITLSFDTEVYTDVWGASLKIDYDLPISFTGIWYSLWGHSDYTQTQYLDFKDIYGDLNGPDRDFEQIHFWVRGSGLTTDAHNIKVELKDSSRDFDRTAYRYISIDDSDTTWREIVLDADVSNASFWSYNLEAPDPSKMKEMVIVLESAFNNPTGTFYIDHIHFVDDDDDPFNQLDDDEAFLEFVSKKTFLYFLDRYDPQTGLFQDRSTFPDLMSTAATGFGLTALTIGESRGWISSTLAVEMVSRTLNALYNGQTATNTVSDSISNTNGYKGFYYHFLDPTGRRINAESELSPVDTAILLAGVLTVREHFSNETEIVRLSDELYQRIEWGWMLDQNPTITQSANISGSAVITANPNYNRFYLAWKPECDTIYVQTAPEGGCFSRFYWDYYTDEIILLNLLAIASPTYSVTKDVFYSWVKKVIVEPFISICI